MSDIKRKRRPNPKTPHLTAKEQRFVKAYASGEMNGTEAVKAAGYNVTTQGSASNMAAIMLNKPKIQAAIQDVIAQDFPDLPHTAASILNSALKSDDVKLNDKLKAIQLLAGFLGWAAPIKRANLNVSLKETLKLPEE